jgi:hypothetical protein
MDQSEKKQINQITGHEEIANLRCAYIVVCIETVLGTMYAEYALWT